MRYKSKNRLDASAQAVDASKEVLMKTQKRSAEVTKVVTSIRLIREHNHFADQLRILFGGDTSDPRHG